MTLRLLAPGTGQDGNGDPAIDIFAVHGLNPMNSTDHAFNTWQKPLNDKGCLWLRDCFPKVQPNARIFLYEYNSSPVFGAAKDSFVGEANQLLDEIYGERWQLKQGRPIILIGHSLGGILIKQCLVNAWANEKYRGIKEATHALVFFGTPHLGPSRNLQVGLGMACAKIARSLPVPATSKIIEILEGGSLFSDLLSESFRHQLEQYKILSCYEGLGDIVPFNSAVLGLPGQRETQLRINADHSNMCRYDMSTQADIDNYRKVERNLQMLCADALVDLPSGDSKPDANSHDVIQGGVDLSSVLLQQPNTRQINMRIQYPTDFADVPELAWQVYRLCDQSSSVPFAEAAASDVSHLYIGLRSLKDRLQTDTFSVDRTEEIQDLLNNCLQTLQGLESVVGVFQSTSRNSQAHWNNPNNEKFYGLKRLKLDLESNVSMINALNKSLSSRSMNSLTQKLDNLVSQLNGGYEVSSSLSSHISRASISGPEGWSAIYPDLVEGGFPKNLLSEQREYIQRWLMNAVIAGRIDTESQDTNIITSYDQRLERAGSNLDDDNHIAAGIVEGDNLPPHLTSAPSSQKSKAIRRKEAPQFEVTVLPVKSSKGWARSLTSKLKYATFSSDDAFYKAARNGDASSVQKILASKSQIDLTSETWRDVLLNAVRNDHVEVLRTLISLGTFPDRQEILQACVSSAVSKRNMEATVLLLENKSPFDGEDVAKAMTFLPENALKMLFTETNIDLDHDDYAHFFLFNAAMYGHEYIFRLLVAQYGGINAPVNETTAFHMACRSGNLKSIQLGLELGANVTITDGRGNKPLHALVIGRGNENYDIGTIIKLLKGNGASLDERSQTGQTALHLAAKCAHIKAMEALLEMGLDPDIQNADGNTPLHSACSLEWVDRSIEKFVPSCLKRTDSQRTIFLSELFRPPKRDPRDELHRLGTEEVVRIMLKYGASANARGKEMVTPLHLASGCERVMEMKALLQHRADPHAVDDYGWTPLHYAIVSSSQDAIDLLIPHEVDQKAVALVRVIGNHTDWMDASDLLRVINNRYPRARPLLGLDPEDSMRRALRNNEWINNSN